MKNLMMAAAGAVLAVGAFAAELPAGYTQLDKIVVPRGAYIDTGYRPNRNSCVEMDVTVQGKGEYWFGCWDTDYNRGAFAFGNDGWGIYAGYGDQGGTFGSVVTNGRHKVALDRNVVKVDDGETYTWSFNEDFGREGELANNLYLFAQNRRGTIGVAGAQTTIICHGCIIYDNKASVRWFVPCIAPNGRSGLYDQVGQKFYALHLSVLPSGYTAVECIVAPRGAYIDTGYKPNQNSRTMMDVTVQGTSEYWFSVSGANYTTDAYALCNDYDLGVYYAVDGDGGSFKSTKTGDGCVPNGRHLVGITPYSMLVDGEVWATKERKGGFQLPKNLYFFASNGSSTQPYTRTTQTSIVCHGCTIVEGDTPKRNFVPCVRTADAAAGLYDMVEGKFYGNAGTGRFTTSDSCLPFGRTLESGTYEITESFAFAAPAMESALKIADGATVTLSVTGGVTVALRGGDAFEVWGAGAGIEVPAGATLRVTGAGRIVACGGRAANGGNGLNGGNGSAYEGSGNFTSGCGGAGGWGGGGAGAGIGGHGSSGGGGGNGGASVTGYGWSYTDISGRPGDNGGAGKSGGTCGTVSVEGTVKVFACGGAAGAADGAGGASGNWARVEGDSYYFGGFGGGGGGGGAKGGAAADIGGGGAGGFGGGGGGGGAYLSRFYWDTFSGMPGWGAGGRGAKNGASGGASYREGEKVWGGEGGANGAAGTPGGGGTLTVADGAAAYARDGRYSVGRPSETAEVFYDNGQLLWVSGGMSGNLPYSVVDNGTGTLGTGWYVVRDAVNRGEIAVNGTANLVLLHGASLTVSGSSKAAAISVPAGNELNVFGAEGGTLAATGGYLGAGIGGGDGGAAGAVTINGGAVTATGGNFGAGIGGGSEGAGGAVTINGGTVTATGGVAASAIGGGAKGSDGSLTLGPRVCRIDDNHYREGVVIRFEIPQNLRLLSARADGGPVRTAADGAVRTATFLPGQRLTLGFAAEDFRYELTGNAEVSFGPYYADADLDGGQLPGANPAMLKEDVVYSLPNGETAKATACPLYSTDADMAMGQCDWYFVQGEVAASVIEVRGEVNLILADGATLTANGGIRTGLGAKLNVYGQGEGTGRLVANGAYRCAGIGGGDGGLGGAVTIDGGSVKATAIQGQPHNGRGQDVYRVTVEVDGLGAGKLRVEGLQNYGTRDIVPIDGRVYLYLPNGTHSFSISGGSKILNFYAVVNGRDTAVEPQAIGFTVNGADIGNASGADWSYDESRCLHLSKGGTYVLSGLATNNEVQVSVEASDATLVFSNAVVYARGRPALTVGESLDGIRLGMAGKVSYLVATNGAANGASVPAVQAGSVCEISLAPGGERIESMICVYNFGESPAVCGRSPRVGSGSLCVWADEAAAQGNVEYDSASEIMAIGDDPDSTRYATESAGAKCVLVAPFCRVLVPETPGIASCVVSNRGERISEGDPVGGTNVFKVMVHDGVTIDFVAAEGYEIISGGSVAIPSVTDDVTVGSAACPAPDVRRQLTVTLPESPEGVTYVVTENGEEVKGEGKGEGVAVYPVRSGYDVEIVCTARAGWRIVSETNVVAYAGIQESRTLAAADLPRAWRVFTVAVPEVENAVSGLSSSDARMEWVGAGMALIISNSEVTVTFAACDGYRIAANGGKAWTLTGDVTFGETEGFPLPTVEGIPGTVNAPWTVGENVRAYTNEFGELTISGTGAMYDFTDAADVPWDSDAVRSVAIGEGVTKVGANAWAALADAVTINGAALSVIRLAAPGLGPAAPAGAISGAEFAERVQIVDGKAHLGVSVYTSDAVENPNWSVATNGVIEVPAPGKSGFFILKSR